VDFSVFVSGPDAKSTYFYEEGPEYVRFFSRGNELSISSEGVHYRGTGGGFCEYMFGVEKSLKDLMKKEVLNRLVMFGAYLDRAERLVFTNRIEGSEPYEKLFFQGHAVVNYFFFVSSDYQGEAKRRQREILRAVGKYLKRTPLLQERRDRELVQGFLQHLKEPHSTVFIFKLKHTANEQYYRAFQEAYLKDKALGEEAEAALSELAQRLGVDYYQQERMKIDVMYRHPENRPIVDEYRDILVEALKEGALKPPQVARLRRLKTLKVRNSIPDVLFETLEEMLLKGRQIQELQEAEYLREARAILEGLFFKEPSLRSHIIKEDIVRLIRAKHQAYTKGDMGFEQMLLDVGKACDEAARQQNDFSPLEELSSILAYFDRYDHVQASMSQLAFMQNVKLTEELVRSLVGNKREFDELQEGLFEELFVRDLLGNKYITHYGRKKVQALAQGLKRVLEGESSLRDVVASLRMIADQERLYWEVHRALKEKLRSFYPRLDLSEGREEIRQDIEAELAQKGVARRLPAQLFEKVLLDLKKESFYLNHLLPLIIKSTDTSLREDFIANSGLDRFYIETLEKEYFRDHGLDMFLLELLKGEAEKSLSAR